MPSPPRHFFQILRGFPLPSLECSADVHGELHSADDPPVQRALASDAMELTGLHLHIGSQVFSVENFLEGLRAVAPFVRTEGLPELIVGGGLGVAYLEDEEAPTLPIADFRNAPEERALQQDLRDSISKALDELSSEHREILIQREIDGLSYGEIAELMQLELGTVKSRIARARLALRQVLLRDGNFFEKTPSDKVKEAKGGGVR